MRSWSGGKKPPADRGLAPHPACAFRLGICARMLPRALVLRALGERQQLWARGQIWQPDIVKIELRYLRFRHSARWSANSAEPQALIRPARRPESQHHDRQVPIPYTAP